MSTAKSILPIIAMAGMALATEPVYGHAYPRKASDDSDSCYSPAERVWKTKRKNKNKAARKQRRRNRKR